MYLKYMFQYYRNYKRDKGSFFINILGLSFGLACTLIIYLWVNDELNIDKFNAKDSQLFQVLSNHEYSTGILTAKATTGMLVHTLAEEMPEIETIACYVNYGDNILLSVNEKKVKSIGKFGSKDFFQVFPFPLLQGSIGDVLSSKDAIVISEKLAFSLFDSTENIIGKSIEIEHNENYNVTGIFKDIPENSSLKFDFLLSYVGLKEKYPDSFSNWGNTGPRTFIVLKQHTKIGQFKNKIKNFIKEKSKDSNTTLIIQPYSETYLYNNFENGVLHGGRIIYIKLFSIVALFVLVIACVNFMNLSTAKASKRAKEVGIKKALGASRKTLIIQFLGESLFISFLSLILAFVIVLFILPEFNILTHKNLALNFSINQILLFVGITVFTGLAAGSYPALYLSSFNVAILKEKFLNSRGENWTRKGLVVFQFTISVILILIVLVVSKQLSFIKSQNPGYNKENVIFFEAEGEIRNKKEAFISEIKKIPGILNATCSDHTMIGGRHTTSLTWEGKKDNENISFEFAQVGFDILETFGMGMASGRSFSRDYGDEGSKIILNETAIKVMGIKEPIGKVVNLWGENKEIIGVLKDFHFESFHEKVKPMFFNFNTEQTSMIIVRLKVGSDKEIIRKLDKFYHAFNPGFIFDYKFLDQTYLAQYAAENQVAILTRYFAGIAILISCLGLFGLVSFLSERRSKEIGIRKIMGAREFEIIYYMSNEFVKLVLLAIILAMPISYLIVNQWLGNFAYRTNLSLDMFILSGLLALGIALITVSWQTWRAATRNPIESLRYE